MHRPALVVGAVLFLIGAICGATAGYLLPAGDEHRLDSEGRPGRAEVLHKAIHADRTAGSAVRPGYRIDYRFTPAQADVVTAVADIDAELWQRLGRGDAVEVVYLPSNPSVHRVEGQHAERGVAIALALAGLLFAALGLWSMRRAFLRPQPPGQPSRPGFGDRLAAWIARSPAFTLGIAGILFFLPFATAGVAWFGTQRGEEALFAARSQSVAGMVLNKAVVHKRRSIAARPSHITTHYQVSYRFQSDAGEELIGTSEIDADAWERLKERGPIAVRYVAGSPWLHRLSGEGGDWGGPLVFLAIGGLGMLAGAGAAVWGWPRWSGRKTSRPKRAAQAAAAALTQAQPEAAPARQPSLWALVVGGIFFVVGCAAFIEGLGDLLQERRYASEGRLADARITEKRLQEARRSGTTRTEYVALYRFTTAEGQAAEGQAVLEVAAWEAAKPGDRIRVRYLSSAPQTNRAAAEGGIAGGILIMALGVIFAAAGAGIAYAGWWLPRRAGRS